MFSLALDILQDLKLPPHYTLNLNTVKYQPEFEYSMLAQRFMSQRFETQHYQEMTEPLKDATS